MPTDDQKTNNEVLTRRRMLQGAAAAGLTGVAGCSGGGGGSSGGTTTQASDGTDTATATATDTATATPSLEERAKADGKVAIAQTTSGMKEFYNNWESDTGISHTFFRTDQKKMATRILQEYNADNVTFDITGTTGGALVMYNLANQGAIGTIPDEAIADTPAEAQMDNRLGMPFINKALTVLYNENVVSNPPTTLDELFQDKWKGKITADVRDSEMILAARKLYDGDEDKVQSFFEGLGGIASWSSSHFDAGKRCASGGIAMSITYKKFQYYDWAGPLKEAKIEGFPTTGSAGYWAPLKNSPHPDAGTYLLRHIYEKALPYFKETINPNLYYEPENAPDSLWYLTAKEAPNVDQEALDNKYEEWTNYSG